MTSEFHVTDLLPEYALGIIDDSDMLTVIEHLAGCAACREKLAAYRQMLAALMLSAPEASPASDARQRLLARIRPIQPVSSTRARFAIPPLFDRWLPGWTPIALSGVAILLVAILMLNTITLSHQVRQVPPYDPRQDISATNPYLVRLQPTDLMPQARGLLLIGTDGQQAILIVEGLEPLEDLGYQLWLNRDNAPVSAGYFSVPDSGRMAIPFAVPDLFFNYLDMGVTIEPVGGSMAPSGTLVMNGTLDLLDLLSLLE